MRNFRKIFKMNFEKKKSMRFLAQFRIQISHFGVKMSFFELFTIVTFIQI